MKIEKAILSHELFDELEDLFEAQNKEINLHSRPLDIARSAYLLADISGTYKGYLVRKDEKIIGYLGYWLCQDKHNQHQWEAYQDVLYVSPEYRDSRIGLKLIKFSEEDLTLKVDRIIHQSTVHKDISALFKRLGYEEVSVVYKKEI